MYLALTIAADELNQGLPKTISAERDFITGPPDLGSARCIIRSLHGINESIVNLRFRTSACLPISFYLMSIH